MDDTRRPIEIARTRTLGPANDRAIRPYPIYWGGWPEGALLAKDAVRHHLVRASDAIWHYAPLRPIWRASFGARTLRDIQRAGLLFIHIPKTAGTSISGALYGRNLPHYSIHRYRRLYGQALQGTPSFAVIRDPIERFVSAYRFHRGGGSNVVLSDRYERARLKGINDFDRLIAFFSEDPRRLARASAFLPQTGYVADADGAPAVDALFAMHDEAGEPIGLRPWLGLVALPRLNASAPMDLELSAPARRALSRLYEADMALFEQALHQSRQRCAERGWALRS